MGNDSGRYRVSPLAEQDMEDIWVHGLHKWSNAQADAYHAEIIAAIEGLARGNRIGRSAQHIRTGYFKYGVGRHMLFYRTGPDYLDIIRILHQQMDFPAHLK